MTYGLGTVNQNLPGYVVLLDHRGGPISGPPNWGSGFMPATYQGTQFRTSGDPILNLRPPTGISAAQQRNQLDLLAKLSQPQAAGSDNSELIGPHRQLRAGLPDAGERPGGRRPRRANRPRRSGSTGSTTRGPSGSAGAA